MILGHETTQDEKLAKIGRDFKAQVWDEINRLYDVKRITQAEARELSPSTVNSNGELVTIVKV